MIIMEGLLRNLKGKGVNREQDGVAGGGRTFQTWTPDPQRPGSEEDRRVCGGRVKTTKEVRPDEADEPGRPRPRRPSRLRHGCRRLPQDHANDAGVAQEGGTTALPVDPKRQVSATKTLREPARGAKSSEGRTQTHPGSL